MSYIARKYSIRAEVVMQMAKDGIIDWRIEYLHEFWIFYNELLKDRTRTDAREEMMLHYNLSQRSFYRWICKAKGYFL